MQVSALVHIFFLGCVVYEILLPSGIKLPLTVSNASNHSLDKFSLAEHLSDFFLKSQ